MLDLNFDPFPILTTERLLLRETNKNDINEVFFLRSDRRVMQYVKKAPCQTLDEAAAYIDKIGGMRLNNEGITWAITVKGNHTLIGNIAFWRIVKEHHRAEIGYMMHPDWYGKGIMYEAIGAVLEYGFNTMKLHSVEANTDAGNIPSHRTLERHNFVREGYFKGNYYYEGQFFDTATYSLVAPGQQV